MNTCSLNKTRGQHGMTLVELLVTLVLSIFLVGGIIQIFIGNRVSFAFNEGLARIQENARYSLEHIAFTSRMAGYSGCISDVGVFNNLATNVPFRDDIANGIQGYNANGTGAGQTYTATAADPAPSLNPANWTPALPAQLVDPAIVGGGIIPGSDVLIVRGATGPAMSLVAPFNDPSQLFVATTHNFIAGEILVVADCQKASIFQLTAAGTSGGAATLVHGNSGGFAPGNAAATWPAEQDFGLGAEVSRHQTFAFYIGQGSSNRPSLFQVRLQADGSFDSEELVSGVDTFQVRYAVDTLGNDGVPDVWQSADAVVDWTQVLSIEITVLARSNEEYGSEVDTAVYNLAGTQFDPVDDRRLRQVYSTTVGVRNRLP